MHEKVNRSDTFHDFSELGEDAMRISKWPLMTSKEKFGQKC